MKNFELIIGKASGVYYIIDSNSRRPIVSGNNLVDLMLRFFEQGCGYPDEVIFTTLPKRIKRDKFDPRYF